MSPAARRRLAPSNGPTSISVGWTSSSTTRATATSGWWRRSQSRRLGPRSRPTSSARCGDTRLRFRSCASKKRPHRPGVLESGASRRSPSVGHLHASKWVWRDQSGAGPRRSRSSGSNVTLVEARGFRPIGVARRPSARSPTPSMTHSRRQQRGAPATCRVTDRLGRGDHAASSTPIPRRCGCSSAPHRWVSPSTITRAASQHGASGSRWLSWLRETPSSCAAARIRQRTVARAPPRPGDRFGDLPHVRLPIGASRARGSPIQGTDSLPS